MARKVPRLVLRDGPQLVPVVSPLGAADASGGQGAALDPASASGGREVPLSSCDETVSLLPSRRPEVQFRQCVDDVDGLDAHGCDALDQVDDVAWVVVLVAPVVGVVDDT